MTDTNDEIAERLLFGENSAATDVKKSPAEVLGADERLVRKMIRNAFLAGRSLCTSTTGLQDDVDAERYAAERDLSALYYAQVEANARLMAAAPDLLEAIQVLVTDCSQIWSEAEFPALKQARAAIARARGEQSPNHSDQKEVGNG